MHGLSKRSKKLRADFDYVEAGIQQAKSRLAAKLEEVLGEGAAQAAVLLLELAGTRSRAALERLEALASANASESSDLLGPRERRDAYCVASYRNLQAIRDLIGAVHGRPTLELMGLKGILPRNALAVRQLGRFFLKRFAERGLPESRAAMVDLGPTIEELRGNITGLDESLDGLGTELRQAESVKLDTDQALADCKRAFSRYSTLAAALLAMAGLKEEERQLRPKRPHRRRKPEPEDQRPTGT